MLRGIGSLAAIVLVAACAREAPAPAAATPDRPAVPPGAPVRGELRQESGALRFTECGALSTAEMPLVGGFAPVQDAWNALGGGPAGRLYVEVRGAPDRGGFRVESLVRAAPVGEGARCERPVFDGDFLINGQEPFWAIDVRRDGIVYRSPEEPKGRKYPYAATRAAGQLFYATRLEGPPSSTLEIELKPVRCVDAMSGEIRDHEALVRLDGRELHGCATAGVPFGEFGDDPLDELERYAGTYEPQALLWKSEPLRARLPALLGPKLARFEERFQVSGPLRKDRGIYFATGNLPHQGGVDVAAFLADPDSDTINVVIVENRKREDFKEGGRDVAVPPDVAAFLTNLE